MPPKRRSAARLIVVIVVIVVLLVAGGITAIVLVVGNSSGKTPLAGGSQAPATNTATSTVKLNAPDRIGTLQRKADQSQVDRMRSMMSSAGLEQPFAVVYDDTAASGREAIVWGGVGTMFGMADPQAELDSFFSSAGDTLGAGATVGTRTNVTPPSSVGGVAQCAQVSGSGVRMALCAWVGNGAVLGFIFTGVTPTQAGDEVNSILTAVVSKS
jgi:hypothetical protein